MRSSNCDVIDLHGVAVDMRPQLRGLIWVRCVFGEFGGAQMRVLLTGTEFENGRDGRKLRVRISSAGAWTGAKCVDLEWF
jgi:hypothetical protein